MGRYDVAQICLNGHVITSSSQSRPEHQQVHCKKCGATTIQTCPACNKPIRGHYLSDNYRVGGYVRPAFCIECGEPFPWTIAAEQAALELVDDQEQLSAEEKDLLKQSINDLTRETPQSQVAANRFKRLVAKVGKDAGDLLYKFALDLASEAVKKMLIPSP